MPIYDVKCTNKECEEVKEVMLKSSDVELPACTKCQSKTERILSGPKGLLILGGGSYLNGYKVFGSDKR